jgi:hypothetical protein
MPTRLGNVLRAAESRPGHRYGLDAVVCWVRLWLTLPEQAHGEIEAARGRLDEGVRLWLWSLLFVVWTPLSWWALAVAMVGMVIGYRLAVTGAVVYGQLVLASFDLYRKGLYEALGRDFPNDPQGEYTAGLALTALLERGPALAPPEPLT